MGRATIYKTHGADRDYPDLATCVSIFRGSMRKFFDSFSVFIDAQTVLVTELYGVIYAMEEFQNMGFTNIWFGCVSALVSGAFTLRTKISWMFVISETLVLIIMKK